MLPGIFLILSIITLDQLLKIWAVKALADGAIVLIPKVFEFTYVENRGAAFSFLENHISLFVVLTCVVLGGIFYVLFKQLILTKAGRTALFFIAGGAIGNLVDRIAHGYVIDMFYFRLINFPVFNIADIFIVCGGILFIYYVLVQQDKAYANKKAGDTQDE